MFRRVSDVNCYVKGTSCIILENRMCGFSVSVSVIREQENI